MQGEEERVGSQCFTHVVKFSHTVWLVAWWPLDHGFVEILFCCDAHDSHYQLKWSLALCDYYRNSCSDCSSLASERVWREPKTQYNMAWKFFSSHRGHYRRYLVIIRRWALYQMDWTMTESNHKYIIILHTYIWCAGFIFLFEQKNSIFILLICIF